MLTTYEVGQLYSPGRTQWPEAGEYNYRLGMHELRLFWAHPTEAEIKHVTRRPCEFGAVAHGQILFFLHKFQGTEWSDAPYSWHLVKQANPDAATIPEPLQDNERVLLHTILVDASTGIIKGMRQTSLSIGLSRYLHEQIRRQAAAGFDEAHYDRELHAIYRRFTSAELALQAERCIIR